MHCHLINKLHLFKVGFLFTVVILVFQFFLVTFVNSIFLKTIYNGKHGGFYKKVGNYPRLL